MRFGDSSRRVASIASSEKSGRFTIVVLSAAVLILSILLFRSHETVVVIPPKLDHKIKISMDMADSGYKKAWATYIAELVGNVTPANAQFVADSVGSLLSPAVHQQVAGELGAEVFKIQKEGLRSTFQPQRISYEPETDKVFVSGSYMEVSAESEHSLSDPASRPNALHKVYEMIIDIRNGQPLVKEFDSYFGHPRDLAWLAHHKNQTQSDQ